MPPRARSAATAAARKSSASNPSCLPQTMPVAETSAGSSASWSRISGSNSRPGLIALEQLVAIGRHADRVPADDDRPGTLGLPEAEQHRHEADQRVGGPAVVAPERARQGVKGAVCERVAVDGEERPHDRDCLELGDRARRRSVAAWAASSSGTSARSSSPIGSPIGDAQRGEMGGPRCPRCRPGRAGRPPRERSAPRPSASGPRASSSGPSPVSCPRGT